MATGLHYLVEPFGDSPAARIVSDILRDVTDRRGWRQEWDQFDSAIQKEIIETWIHLVNVELRRVTPNPAG